MKTPAKILLFAVLPLGILTAFIITMYYHMGREPDLPVLNKIPPFSFTTQDSVSFTEKDLLGKITIADFIFTSCAGPCPTMTAKMAELQEKLHNELNLRFLSFSVDPEYDTPSVLREYASAFFADTKQWTFLTGNKKEIYSLARKGFLVAVEEEQETILHSTKFVLIDGKGDIRGFYDYDDPTAVTKLLEDAYALLRSL